MSGKALLFDCDGVLADTERYGHLPAFNRMWQECGVAWQWSAIEYGCKLRIGGGKERMASLFDDPTFRAAVAVPDDAAARKALLADWHERKSCIYREIIESGSIPARAGVKRIAEEALQAGWLLGVASTSAQSSVDAVLRHAMGAELAKKFSIVLAGDIVAKKKPSPEIYLLAAERLGVDANECVVIEDSANGLTAAKDAGMHCIVTVSSYTADEDFLRAELVVSSLGDPGGEVCHVIANRSHATPGAWVSIADAELVLAGVTQ